MKHVPVLLVNVNHLESQPFNPAEYKGKYVQVKKTCSYTDLKKRIADVVNHQYKTQIKISDIRLWLCEDKFDDITNSIQKVSEAIKTNIPMQD